ncbi:MAG: hypothetical protein ACXV5J_03385 [Candidatus Angelobacter sp.]
MVGAEANTTFVGRLRIRSRSSDSQAEQQHIARLLRSATLHPASLPASATLVVRRLVDPMPSRLRAGPVDVAPDAAWQRAVAATLEKLASSAARPAYGAVPAEINAVLFYDRAEVLAALALDWMSGALALQWWWRELLRGRDVVSALLDEWIQSPQYVPGALALLTRRSRAAQFVQRLPQQAASELLEAVVVAFAIPRFVAEGVPLKDSSEDRDEPPQMPTITRTAPPRRSIVGPPAPSLFWVPEAFAPGLSMVHRILLIQTLMLRRAPGIARTAAFQKDLMQWQESAGTTPASAGHSTSEVDPALRSVGKQKPSLVERLEESFSEQAMIDGTSLSAATQGDVREQVEPEIETVAAPILEVGRDRRKTRQGLALNPLPIATTDEPAVALQQFQPLAVEGQEILLMQEQASNAAALPEERPSKKALEPSTILDTEYGGIFFLLPLALYLYIYGDFTSPAEPGLELSIWDFLALISFELTNGEIEKDPLWAELASLAGRTKSQQPGTGFDPPDEWCLPPDWLEPFPEKYDAHPVLANGRITTMHPAGFTVLDVADTANGSCDVQAAGKPLDRLQRWVGWMASYFRARLLRALGRDDAVALLCGRPARVVLTLTHVDVTFSLDHHPIEIRMSGLDRDPGWIPAAGRYVSFQFK